jgi:hypothetical protein
MPEGKYFQPVSHFGSGIVTLHTGYLFETEPGFNMLVSGPPNHRKHGIVPLTGIIETDWSPYTFTMNWAFTDPGVTVRFEAGAPFCTFYPVERGSLEKFEPEIRPLEAAPEKKNLYEIWHKSRNKFIVELPKEGTEANDERWQKNYYRVLTPDGADADADHQIKLRLKPFKDYTTDDDE